MANVMQHGRHPQDREQDYSTVQTDVGSARGRPQIVAGPRTVHDSMSNRAFFSLYGRVPRRHATAGGASERGHRVRVLWNFAIIPYWLTADCGNRFPFGLFSGGWVADRPRRCGARQEHSGRPSTRSNPNGARPWTIRALSDSSARKAHRASDASP